jgi:hypothetical protein
MNKRYFAKYLPYDKNFKEGTCRDERTGEIVYYNGDYGEKRPEYLVPVKLFICVGDNIIGILSTGAIWVKDGDEFEERELLQQGSGVNLISNGGFVKILCSNCKTFH